VQLRYVKRWNANAAGVVYSVPDDKQIDIAVVLAAERPVFVGRDRVVQEGVWASARIGEVLRGRTPNTAGPPCERGPKGQGTNDS